MVKKEAFMATAIHNVATLTNLNDATINGANFFFLFLGGDGKSFWSRSLTPIVVSG